MAKKEVLSQIEVEVSPLKESDIDQFDSILTDHVRDSKTGEVITSEVTAIKGYMRGEQDEYGRTRTYLVARDQAGNVLGCMAYAIPDPHMIEHFHLEKPEDSIELLNAFVSDKVFRGKGVGKKLLQAICEAGRQEAKKHLLIHSGPRYEKSWGFYDKLTDQSHGFILNRYGVGRDAKTWSIALSYGTINELMHEERTTTEQIAEYCFQEILKQEKRPLFISITGDSGSGKSYYSKLIREHFDKQGIPYSYIDHDSFLISRKDREPLKEKIYEEGEFKGKTHWEILENWFRMDEYDRVISELRAGKASTFFPYKRELGGPDTTPTTIQPNEFVIFDTTMQTEKTDFVILIDVTQEKIIERKLERDKDLRTPEQIIAMHKTVQGYCWERKRPKHADITVDNNDFTHPFISTE